MKVSIVPQLDDNFCYHVTYEEASILIDVSEAQKVRHYLGERGVSHILSTHKHGDHTAGNREMAQAYPGVTVVGGAQDKVSACTMPVTHLQEFQVGQLKIKCLHTPCHTRGSTCYVIEAPDSQGSPIRGKDEAGYQFTAPITQAMFTGDTVFNAGCGRFFEGDATQMVEAMKTAAEYPNALMFGGHEYTIKNLQFGLQVEPENSQMRQWLEDVTQLRQQGVWSVPTRIADELQINVFMRSCFEARVLEATGTQNIVDCMHCLREWKNSGTKPKL